MLEAVSQERSIYSKSLPLAPGVYRLEIVAKDIVGGNLGSYGVALIVPRPDPEKLETSSMVLVDLMERVAMKSTGSGRFVIGDAKVRPRVDAVFARDEKLGVYLSGPTTSARKARAANSKARWNTKS